MLRLENLDTDLRPAPAAIAATHLAIEADAANSYLPFRGHTELRKAVVDHVSKLSGVPYDWHTECLVTAGGLCGIFNTLLALVEPGDCVLVTDPTYVGLTNRIMLCGGVPIHAQLREVDGVWRVDLDRLARIRPKKLRAALLMSPSMPSGAVFGVEDWNAVAAMCEAHDAVLIYDAAMERILYDGTPYVHPASFAGLRERTITVGSASKELCMIGWRVGWVVGPRALLDYVAKVSLANGVAPVGIAAEATVAALSDAQHFAYVCMEWQARRDALLHELQTIAAVSRPLGGWSLLLNVSPWKCTGADAVRLLFSRGIAVTPMDGWGTARVRDYIRIVFSNEPAERFKGIGQRIDRALSP